MNFDDFSDKLRKLRIEYVRVEGKEMTTVRELEAFLDKKLARPKRKGAKSLRGMCL